ncbi:MAG: hypothetical protein JW754_05310 [Candidatus Aenigmarchaeota archaeon]|nr:hypothetical protein [Candidatus Aenigmarchaeota archaeon]
MGMKGQVEFIVIIALIVLAIVAVFVVINMVAVPESNDISGLGEEKKVIVDSINDLVQRTALAGMKAVYFYGGIPSNSTVKYGMSDVNVWRDCTGNKKPDIGKDLEEIIKMGLNSILKERMDFYGKDVLLSLNDMTVEVNIQKNNLDFRVTIPTQIENISSPGIYTVTIPSMLSEIVSFSDGFMTAAGEGMLENITMASIKHSSGDGWLPLSGIMTGCDRIYFLDESKTKENLETAIRYTLSHMQTGDTFEIAGNPFYQTTSSGMNIGFVYPEEWDIDSNLEFTPNPILIEPRDIVPFSYACTMPFDVSYSFRYPAVVVLDDPLFDDLFKFAVMVNIDDSSPSKRCKNSYTMTYDEDYNDLCFRRDDCPFRINVKDDFGVPVEGAEVLFDRCYLGRTDSSGSLESSIPCFIGELNVKSEGHGVYSSMEKADDLNGKSVTLGGIPTRVILNLMGVPLKKEGMGYSVTGDAQSINGLGDPLSVTAYIHPYLSSGSGFILTNTYGGTYSDSMEFFPTGKYIYKAIFTVGNNQTGGSVGYMETIISLDRNSGNLYVYLPVVTEDGQGEFRGSIDLNDIDSFSSLFAKCGIESISSLVQRFDVPCDNNG